MNSKILEKYAGEYTLPDFSLVIQAENGKLFGQVAEDPKFELFPESEMNFFLKIVDAQIYFSKDAAGNVIELTLHQNGMDIKGVKIK